MDTTHAGLPVKPRLHRSYHPIAVPGSDEIQLQSDGRLLRLHAAADQFLPRLLALADGTRSIPDILSAMQEWDAAQVLEALRQLHRAHLLEDAAPATAALLDEQQQFYEPQLTFLAHFSEEPGRLQARLAEAQVAVLGAGTVGAQLLCSLADSGVGSLVHVVIEADASGAPATAHAQLGERCRERNAWVRYRTTTADADSPASLAAAVQGSQLLVTALDRPAPRLLERINDVCLGATTPWLLAGIRAWEGYVGPTVLPRQTACYKCFDLRMKANLVHYEPYLLYEAHLRAAPHQRPFGTLPQFGRTVADLAAVEVARLVTQFQPPITRGRIFSLDFLTFRATFHDVLKLPRCPACGEPSQQLPRMRPWTE